MDVGKKNSLIKTSCLEFIMEERKFCFNNVGAMERKEKIVQSSLEGLLNRLYLFDDQLMVLVSNG